MTDTPFDLFGFLTERTFPTEDVVVYTNEQLGLEAAPLVAERAKRIEKRSDADVSDIDQKLKKIEADARKSAIIFHLRGVPQHVIDEAYKPQDQKGGARILAAMIQSTTGPDGSEDHTVHDLDSIDKLFGILPAQAQKTLTAASSRLILASLAFDGIADAGFLAKS